jgi:hypothetical protein
MSPVSQLPSTSNIFDDDDEGEWQDMPVVCEDEFANGLDAEDQKKYHYVPSAKRVASGAGNATGNLIDVDDRGVGWRSKIDVKEENILGCEETRRTRSTRFIYAHDICLTKTRL